MTHLRLQAGLFGLLLASSLVLGLYTHVDSDALRFEAMVVGFDAVVVFAFSAAYWSEIRFLFFPRLASLLQTIKVTAASVAILVLMGLGFELMERAGLPFAIITDGYIDSGFPLWAVYVWISAIPALCEEVAFRGVIQQGLLHVGSKREAWFIQGALFGALHLAPIAFVTHTLMGLAFGWVRERSVSIYPSMLMHAAWNAWIVFQETAG